HLWHQGCARCNPKRPESRSYQQPAPLPTGRSAVMFHNSSTTVYNRGQGWERASGLPENTKTPGIPRVFTIFCFRRPTLYPIELRGLKLEILFQNQLRFRLFKPPSFRGYFRLHPDHDQGGPCRSVQFEEPLRPRAWQQGPWKTRSE